jgi:hypothetical protein
MILYGEIWEEVARTSGFSFTDVVPISKRYLYKVASTSTVSSAIRYTPKALESRLLASETWAVTVFDPELAEVPRPPEISGIRSEGDVQSADIQPDRSRAAQLIISWETDEPATSQVLYGEGAGGDNFPFSTQTDSQMRMKHVIVVNNLSPSKVYHFKVVSKDGASNVGESGSVTAITPKGTGTVIENVLGSLGRIFGFLQ